MPSQSIQVAVAGPTQIVKGAPGKVIHVFAFSLGAVGLDATDQVNVKWQSGSTDLTGWRPLNLAGPVWDMAMSPMRVVGPTSYFTTKPGEDLNLNLSASVDVGGFVHYRQEQV